MTTVLDARPPSPSPYFPTSRPRPPVADAEAVRACAAEFLAGGITAAEVRSGAHPEDGLLAGLADAMDDLAGQPPAAA